MNAPRSQIEPQRSAMLFPVGPLVRGLFAAFESRQLEWAVLRNVEYLPEYTRNDIDLLISRKHLRCARRIIEETICQHGWRICRIISRFECLSYVLVGPSPESKFLTIDVLITCRFRANRFADESIGIQRRRKVAENLWAVPVGFEAAVTAVKEIAQHGKLPGKSQKSVCSGATLDPATFAETVVPYLGGDLSARLLSACRDAAWSQAAECSHAIRLALGRWSLSALFRRLAFLCHEVVYHLHPPLSMLVVIIGPDGSGKTTIARGVCDRLQNKPFRKCLQLEFNFRILPRLQNLKRFAGWAPVPPVTSPAPHSEMHREHSTIRAMAYIAYYSLDLLLGRLFLRRWRGQWGLIVFSRYFYDYYYLKGYRKAPQWFLHLMERLAPTPDLVLFLERDADQIYSDKPELELTEIVHQQAMIRALLKERSNATTIKAGEGIEKTVTRVSDTILRKLLAER